MTLDMFSEYADAGLAAAAATTAALATRVGHTTGTTVSMLIGSVFLARHLGIYTNNLSIIPPAVFKVLGIYLSVLLFIRLKTRRHTKAYVRGFPVQVYKPRGCTRVATDFNKRAKGLEAPVFDATVSDVHISVIKWLRHVHADIIAERPDYVYARCYTRFMGFPDDIAIRLKPVGPASKRKTVVEIQAENVLGVGDLNVNLGRVTDCIAFLNYSRKVRPVLPRLTEMYFHKGL